MELSKILILFFLKYFFKLVKKEIREIYYFKINVFKNHFKIMK